MRQQWSQTEERFRQVLEQEEKSAVTIEKYLRDVHGFLLFLQERELNKEEIIAYKNGLVEKYAPTSINSMLISVNRFLCFIGREECCVKLLKLQQQIFRREEKELTKKEYQQLLGAAGNTRISLVIQTICGTGIRVSELKYITVEAVWAGKALVNCKNKRRVIFIPVPLQKALKKYIKKSGRKSGTVFVTKNGNPLNRSNIWRDMKRPCRKAGVSTDKVFPHNLRHLFARTFYAVEKDIVRLADLLGHSSINTTRIYTMETGHQHLCCLEKVQKILTT